MTTTNLDSFTLAYVESALWSSTSEEGEPLDGLYSIDDIHPDTLAEMVKDCEDFRESFGQFTAADEERAGHDFWLTRNGHGAGFWDGDWSDEYPIERIEGETDDQWDFRAGSKPYEVKPYRTIGDFLTAMSKPHGEFNLYVGDDGMIHGS